MRSTYTSPPRCPIEVISTDIMGADQSTDLLSTPQVIAQNALLDNFCAPNCDITSKSISLPSGDLNYIEVVSKTKKKDAADANHTLVMAHGYGSGLGFFYPNYAALAEQFDRVISVDWLGMGSSSRKPNGGVAPYKSITGDWENFFGGGHGMHNPTRATNFFIDSLEEFRHAKDLSQFVLAGHSLGGYLSARYAMKYPSHLSGLVLISPVGVPQQPPKSHHVKVS